VSVSVTSREFFDEKYRSSSDPWAFGTNDYERSRYSSIVSAIGYRRYLRAFEPGCSIGVLTAGLASICDEVIATDISPVAVGYARVRCADFENVTISCETLPGGLPSGPLDLVVLSEVGYYLREDVLRSLARELTELLSLKGVLLAAHWLGRSEDHILSGDEVHSVLRGTEGLALDYEERHTGFRLDRWLKR
jgi:protein-L-isoaspartate O-methyltransferase